jgi:hypothetical protein
MDTLGLKEKLESEGTPGVGDKGYADVWGR